MSFDATLDIANGVARITLEGELDAAATPQFKAQVERAAQAKIRRLVLLMENLSYMSSAGIRELVFAKQKIGIAVDLYLVGVQDGVLETIKMTGVDRSVTLLDSYDALLIEAP
jgi:anti-anti-sigma factor